MTHDQKHSQKFKILIADDHALFRRGVLQIVSLIGEEHETIEANSIEEMYDLLAKHSDVDLILLDLLMPGVEGMSSLEKLRSDWPEVPVITISAKEDTATIRDALALGAMGFIPKSSAASVTSGAIQLVLSGGIYIPPALLNQDSAPSEGAANRDEANCHSELGLTARQVEVLDMISQGKSNSSIAQELGLTEGSVKMHVSRIFKVLKVNNRTSAAARFNDINRQLSQ